MIAVYVLGGLILALALFDRFFPVRAANAALRMERWRAGLAVRSANIAGFAMPYLEGGDGAPLVLVHGFGGDKDNFVRVSAFLRRRYRIVIPDLPGFGDASRDPKASYRIADQVERLDRFIAALGLGRVHLGGNSMGGAIVAEYAGRHPDKVASLWLLDAAGTAAAHDTPLVRDYLATGRFPLLLKSEGDFSGLMRATMSRRPFFPSSLKRILGRRAVADYELHARILGEVASDSPALEAQFSRIETPALIVWGGEDRILDRRGAAALQALLPHGRLVVMPGIGHLPMLEAPRRAAKDYLAFRRSLDRASA